MSSQITVKKIISSGDGIGWADDITWFIPYGAPGDVIKVLSSEKRKRHRVVTDFSIIVPSPQRINQICPVFGRCGGCSLQHISCEHHRDIKTAILHELFAQKQQKPPVHIDFISPGTYGIRTRAKVLFRDGRAHFREKRSHDVVAFSSCPLLHPGLDDVVKTDDRHRAIGGHVQYEYSSDTGEWLPQQKRITRIVGGTPFSVSRGAFFQPSEAGAKVLHDLVAEYAAAGCYDRALDLFAGGGLFTRAVQKFVSRVDAVENSGPAATDYRRNTDDHCHLHRRSAYTLDSDDFSRFDLMVADPPRHGLGASLCREISVSSCSEVVLVSCDPAAFVRDAGAFSENGLLLTSVTIVDQFPLTAHFETVGVFRR